MKKIIICFLLIIFAFSIVAQDKPDALKEYKSENYSRAIEICLKEIEAMPRNMDSYAVLCWSYLKLKKYKDALTYGNKALAIARNDHRIVEILGEANYFLGNNDDALKFFQEYISLAPTADRVGVVYYYMGEIYVRKSAFNHADIAFSTAVYHYPNIARWWTRLGFVREKAGALKYAEEAYNKALTLNPSYSEASEGLRRVKKSQTGI